MGYEIAGGLGVKMASPGRDVIVMVGDGSWLMMSSEIVTAVQERINLIVVLINNHGFASIGALSESLGSEGFGTIYRYRDPASGDLTGQTLPVDLAANAESLGATVIRAASISDLTAGLKKAKSTQGPVVIAIESDRNQRVGGFESWWDVPPAEASSEDSVKRMRDAYDKNPSVKRWIT
jgi:3D-(3,5/4)-trihydroxycyclohexane-1,2-dione acylhydrolase (decyclizing)